MTYKPEQAQLFYAALTGMQNPPLVWQWFCDYDKERRDLAGWEYAYMNPSKLADLQARLEPLAKEKRPLRAYAQEAQAMALLQHGKTAEARQIFVQLQLGQDVPDDVRARAQAGTSRAAPAVISMRRFSSLARTRSS